MIPVNICGTTALVEERRIFLLIVTVECVKWRLTLPIEERDVTVLRKTIMLPCVKISRWIILHNDTSLVESEMFPSPYLGGSPPLLTRVAQQLQRTNVQIFCALPQNGK
eukprot:GEMP01142762.1.p1 GENE.GEMP01142762.1~~GEMP01142762.1.p1  ORF type:complete len:109 (-),score=11.07 GEMP01142762.1:68-394(-)